jgi:phosphatidylserine/phosphatidylglycerophosphate/cardiolipin synthase-like enzyme
MARENHSRQKSRLLRIMRLLRRFQPDQPVTYRRNRVLLFPGGHSFFRSLHAALRSAEHFILAEYYMIAPAPPLPPNWWKRSGVACLSG